MAGDRKCKSPFRHEDLLFTLEFGSCALLSGIENWGESRRWAIPRESILHSLIQMLLVTDRPVWGGDRTKILAQGSFQQNVVLNGKPLGRWHVQSGVDGFCNAPSHATVIPITDPRFLLRIFLLGRVAIG